MKYTFINRKSVSLIFSFIILMTPILLDSYFYWGYEWGSMCVSVFCFVYEWLGTRPWRGAYLYIHMEKLESDAGCLPLSLHLIFLRRCLSLNLEFVVWAGVAKTQFQHGRWLTKAENARVLYTTCCPLSCSVFFAESFLPFL